MSDKNISFQVSIEAYFSIAEYPWKIVVLTSSTVLFFLWNFLIYGIIYYIHLGVNELKKNILDHVAIIFFFYTIGKKNHNFED